MRRLFILSAVLVLAMTACKIETNFGAVINADGSGLERISNRKVLQGPAAPEAPGAPRGAWPGTARYPKDWKHGPILRVL